MYSIYAGDLCIYQDISPLEAYKLISPKLTLEDSAAGSLTMTVPPTNIGYDKIVRLVTTISVRKEGEEIWAGRVLTEDGDFWNNRVLYCEGELSFLNDTTQPQAEYHNISIRSFLETILNIHNAKVEQSKQFQVGVVTVTDSNNSLYRFTNYEHTIECINEKLIGRLGGHIRVRKENGIRYLDYLSDTVNTNTQVIEFGTNLLDFTKKWDLSDFCTVLLPLGNRLEESTIENLDSYLTVESVNDGSPYVVSNDAVTQYGRIERVVHWDDVSQPSNLLRKARKYLSELQFDNMTIELNAIDLHTFDISYESVKVLDKIRVRSTPHGLDRYFPVSKLEIPLDDPSGTNFTLGSNIKMSLTSANNRTNSEILQSIENLPKMPAILKEAKENATQIMHLATNGYITITNDDQGSNGLYVTNTRDYQEATKMWLLNMNGFGYSGDGGNHFDVAMTMDGKIVADFITAGVLNGDILKAGSVSATAISQSFKNSITSDINGTAATLRQEFKAADGSLKSTIETFVNNNYATKSSLTQTAELITAEVNKKVNGTDFGTYMQQNYDSFILGFNNNSSVLRISTGCIDMYQDGSTNANNRVLRLNENGMEMWRNGTMLGKIGTNYWVQDNSVRGLVFDMNMECSYMTWSRKESYSSKYYEPMLSYSRAGGIFERETEGIHLYCSFFANGYSFISPNLTDVRSNGVLTYTGQRTFITDIVKNNNTGEITWNQATYNIINGMFTN